MNRYDGELYLLPIDGDAGGEGPPAPTIFDISLIGDMSTSWWGSLRLAPR